MTQKGCPGIQPRAPQNKGAYQRRAMLKGWVGRSRLQPRGLKSFSVQLLQVDDPRVLREVDGGRADNREQVVDWVVVCAGLVNVRVVQHWPCNRYTKSVQH